VHLNRKQVRVLLNDTIYAWLTKYLYLRLEFFDVLDNGILLDDSDNFSFVIVLSDFQIMFSLKD
jgi:hypothetical protein